MAVIRLFSTFLGLFCSNYLLTYSSSSFNNKKIGVRCQFFLNFYFFFFKIKVDNIKDRKSHNKLGQLCYPLINKNFCTIIPDHPVQWGLLVTCALIRYIKFCQVNFMQYLVSLSWLLDVLKIRPRCTHHYE